MYYIVIQNTNDEDVTLRKTEDFDLAKHIVDGTDFSISNRPDAEYMFEDDDFELTTESYR